MGANIKPENPLARIENLLVEDVAGELLIYDVKTNRAHCLNESAAAIWRHCDGSRSLDKLADDLFPKLESSEGQRLVALGIERLRRRRLLDRSTLSGPTIDLSKRQMLKKVAILAAAAGVAAPLVCTVLAPTSAYAFSCGHDGAPCTSPFDCCLGLCTGGHCQGG